MSKCAKQENNNSNVRISCVNNVPFNVMNSECCIDVNCNLILQAVTFLISCLTHAYAHNHRARRKMHNKLSSRALVPERHPPVTPQSWVLSHVIQCGDNVMRG